MEKGLPGYACMIIRKWHKGNKGGYQKFVSTYKNSVWITDVTKQEFEKLKTAPVKRPDQKKYYKTSGSPRKSRNVNKIYMTL